MKDEQIVHNAIDFTVKSGTSLIGKQECLSIKLSILVCFLVFLTDTAAVYHNEHMVGEAIRKACSKHNLELSDVFVTTKLGQTIASYLILHLLITLAVSSISPLVSSIVCILSESSMLSGHLNNL